MNEGVEGANFLKYSFGKLNVKILAFMRHGIIFEKKEPHNKLVLCYCHKCNCSITDDNDQNQSF